MNLGFPVLSHKVLKLLYIHIALRKYSRPISDKSAPVLNPIVL